ncbi:MAG: hypothetical protein EOP72_00425 [Variovorax sp.]|jgi:hypothetical protein|nr:MAG: hypothetical protein EOP72_00425 [Variovorax sp.]
MDTPQQFAHIKGWGADLDPANRPAYPKERTPPRLDPPVRWQEPPAQTRYVEVLRSTERPAMTPVFGSGQPPRGVSGSVRRFAFGFSENDLRHWLLLLLADRIDVGEGLVEDLARGHVPRIYSEMGGRAELTHNPMGAAKKALTVAAVLGAVYLVARRRSSRR